MEDNIGSSLLDDLENLGLEFEADNNGDTSPSDPNLIAPPESEYDFNLMLADLFAGTAIIWREFLKIKLS